MRTTEAELRDGRRRRRRHSAEFKAMVIAKCSVPDVSIAAVALRHQLNANLLRRWVADARVAEISRPAAVEQEAAAPIAGFLPVQIDPAAPSRSTIDIELRRGPVVMR